MSPRVLLLPTVCDDSHFIIPLDAFLPKDKVYILVKYPLPTIIKVIFSVILLLLLYPPIIILLGLLEYVTLDFCFL